MQSMKLCAIRETFEECGILMLEGNEDAKTAWSAIAEEERRRWRTKVGHDSLADICHADCSRRAGS